MRVAMLTREWPPHLYGGAGVHVTQLVQALRRSVAVEVLCFGEPRPDALARAIPADLSQANLALQSLGVDMSLVASMPVADLMHSHTWHTNLAGHLGGLLEGIPHVITAHSLEPLRPWKAEQLGGGYRISQWIEAACFRDAGAIITVSEAMRSDLLQIHDVLDPARVFTVHNGVDSQAFAPDPDDSQLLSLGVSRPYVLFVGRITTQKGLIHLLRAARDFPDLQLVLYACSPDTAEMAAQTAAAVDDLRRGRGPGCVRWIRQPIPHPVLRQLYSHALALICPSIYEPLGLVNLEAMACATAVIASAVGGIPEVVVDGSTGRLVPYQPDDPEGLESGLAAAVHTLAADPEMARRMGEAGRARAMEHFNWSDKAEQTLGVYRKALGGRAG